MLRSFRYWIVKAPYGFVDLKLADKSGTTLARRMGHRAALGMALRITRAVHSQRPTPELASAIESLSTTWRAL